MNKERLQQVADVLRGKAPTPKHGRKNILFNMYTLCGEDDEGFSAKGKHKCGTAACIAGYAAAMFSEDKFQLFLDGELDADSHATRFLGLTCNQSSKLFYPDEVDKPWSEITPAEAAAVIENLIETGDVDWTII